MPILINIEKIRALFPFEGNIEEHPDLETVIFSVESAIQNFLGRKLQQAYFVEQFFCPYYKTKLVHLNALPIQNIYCIVNENNEKVTDFQITPFGIRLSEAKKNSQLWISYQGGWDSLPGDIERALLLQTVTEIKGRDYIGIPITTSGEGYSITIPEVKLTKEVLRLLRPHQHPAGLRSFNYCEI